MLVRGGPVGEEDWQSELEDLFGPLNDVDEASEEDDDTISNELEDRFGPLTNITEEEDVTELVDDETEEEIPEEEIEEEPH